MKKQITAMRMQQSRRKVAYMVLIAKQQEPMVPLFNAQNWKGDRK